MMWHPVTMVHSPSKFTHPQSIIMKALILLRCCKNNGHMQGLNTPSNFEMYFDSMGKLLKLRARETLCGHGSTKILRQNPGPTATFHLTWYTDLPRSCQPWNLLNSPFKNYIYLEVEIKCQLDATEVFIADLIAWSTCFGQYYAHHQELKSIIQWLLPVAATTV